MATSTHIKILNEMASIGAKDEQICKRQIEVIAQFSAVMEVKSKSTFVTTINGKNINEKSCNINQRSLADQHSELVKKSKMLQEKRNTIVKKLEQLEKLKHKLDSSNELSKQTEQLTNLRTVLKYYKILPVEFDYTNKTVSGIIFNTNNEEYHGFELSPKSKENAKYLWKQIEKYV